MEARSRSLQLAGRSPSHPDSAGGPVLNALRRRLQAWPGLTVSVRAARALFHFGPWRVVPRRMIRWLRPVARTREASAAGEPASALVLPAMAPQALARAVRRDSFAVAGVLAGDRIERLRMLAERLPIDEYQLMHLLDDDVHELARAPELLDVVRAYLGAEPALLESTLTLIGPHRGWLSHGRTSRAHVETRATRIAAALASSEGPAPGGPMPGAAARRA